jgi:predicted MFS family arabinose efflux permease
MTPAWPPRDWRMLIALVFLGGGGFAMTVFAWRLATLTAQKSTSPWPVAYALYGVLGLIGIVLTGFSYVLGKRTLNFSASRAGISAGTSGGDADEPPTAIVTTTTSVTTPPAGALP